MTTQTTAAQVLAEQRAARGRSNGQRGRTFERTVARALTADGYLVIRAAGSRGAGDLVAVKPGQILLVQCKLGGAGDLGPAEWNAFRAVAESAGALPILAYRPGLRGLAYWRLTGVKDGPRKTPPAQPWTPDEMATVDGAGVTG
jgi:Holliday junction resolvase